MKQTPNNVIKTLHMEKPITYIITNDNVENISFYKGLDIKWIAFFTSSNYDLWVEIEKAFKEIYLAQTVKHSYLYDLIAFKQKLTIFYLV